MELSYGYVSFTIWAIGYIFFITIKPFVIKRSYDIIDHCIIALWPLFVLMLVLKKLYEFLLRRIK